MKPEFFIISAILLTFINLFIIANSQDVIEYCYLLYFIMIISTTLLFWGLFIIKLSNSWSNFKYLKLSNKTVKFSEILSLAIAISIISYLLSPEYSDCFILYYFILFIYMLLLTLGQIFHVEQ